MKIINSLLKFLFGSLFFLTPLIFLPNTSELFEFNKMIFIYLVTVLVGTLWLFKMILAKKIIFRKTLLDIPILLFFFSQIISTIISIDTHVSVFGYYGRFNGGLLSIISYLILYYAFVSNPIDVKQILKTSLFSSLLVMLYGLPGRLGHDITCFLVTGGLRFDNSCWDNNTLQFQPSVRTFSTLGQPNWLGAFLAINFFIGGYFLYKNRKNLRLTVLNSLYLFSNFMFITFTKSRSALYSIVIGIGILAAYYFYNNVKDKNKYLKYLSLLLGLFFLIFIFTQRNFFNFNNSQLKNTNVTESFDIRRIVWKGAVDLGLKYPFFGTGVETFAYSYYFTRPVEHNLTSEWDFVYNKAHNEYLNYLATSGFIGLGSYLIMIGVFVYFLAKKLKINPTIITKKVKNIKENYLMDKDNYRLALTLFLLVSYTSILVTNFFGFSTTTINLFFYLIPAFIIVIYQQEIDENETEIKKQTNIQLIGIFTVSILSIYLVFSLFVYWLADFNYAKGINYSKSEISDYQNAAVFFEKALRLRYEPIYEDKLSTSLSYLAVIAAYQKQNEAAKNLMQLSDYYNKKSLTKYDKNIFFWKTRAKNQYLFYETTSDIKYLYEGIIALQEAEKIAPTDPKIPYSLAVYYSLLYDFENDYTKKEVWKNKSISEINKALELKYDFQEGLTLKKDFINKYSL